MNVTRRKFVFTVAGAAAGGLFTPVQWKLIDDISIWTQNWPWTPVPRDGAISYVASTCQLCRGGCGIKVRMVDDRPVKIEANATSPVNQGGICPLGIAGLQGFYDPLRIKNPVKKVIDIWGGHTWQDITWDEAIKEVTDKLNDLEKSSMSHTVGLFTSNKKSLTNDLWERLLKGLGSPNNFKQSDAQDSQKLAVKAMIGHDVYPAYDLENAKFILSFGAGLIEGWGLPVRSIRAHSKWEEDGARLIQVESRGSLTASKADEWLAVEPGTEAAVALSLCSEIVRLGLFDKVAVEKSFGFIQFKKELLSKYTSEKMEKVTGIKASVLKKLAKDFATAKNAVALSGKGKGYFPASVQEEMAILSLNILTGRLGAKGGVLLAARHKAFDLPEIQLNDAVKKSLATSRLDDAGAGSLSISSQANSRLAKNILSNKYYNLNLLFIVKANPAYTMPDCKEFTEAIKKAGMVVAITDKMDETAMLADIVLPCHNYLEAWEEVQTQPGLSYPIFALGKPVVKPVNNTKNAGDIALMIAKAKGGDVASAFSWNSFESVLKEAVNSISKKGSGFISMEPGVKPWLNPGAGKSVKGVINLWKKLADGGVWYNSPEYTLAGPATMSGSIEFISQVMKMAFIEAKRCMPGYDGTQLSEGKENFPIIMQPYHFLMLADNNVDTKPFMMKALEDTVLRKDTLVAEINPETASQLGLKDGDKIMIRSAVSSAPAMVHLFEATRPGMISVPLGLGHTVANKFVRGKGINARELMDIKEDPVSGMPLCWNTRVQIFKI